MLFQKEINETFYWNAKGIVAVILFCMGKSLGKKDISG
ncbi:hypothetical protein SAMN05444371_3125 [Epilithonimonas mollis]|uniref:Uncharacterized protein n=1 Tax=Epilithonimonas mollis TaxID=216903 RepID=A0A1M6U4T0_9FLAO|nr:hypothetical protein SAMN05444371_3125 [Epilithonimonas mollis]